MAQAAHLSATCPLCGAAMRRRTVRDGLEVDTCRDCVLGRLAVQPADPFERYRGADYFAFWGVGSWDEIERQKRRSADLLLRRLEEIREHRLGRLLEVGCASGELLAAARERGWSVSGVELCSPMVSRANVRLGGEVVRAAPFDDRAAQAGSVDALVMNDVLEHLPDLDLALATARRLLAPKGSLLICTPDLGSVSARVLGGRWPHYKSEHLHYLSRKSLNAYLLRAGLKLEYAGDAWKALSPEYVAEHFRVYASGALASVLRAAVDRLPPLLRYASVPLLSGNLLAIATRP
jgi:SAM-dependent methyltransferase